MSTDPLALFLFSLLVGLLGTFIVRTRALKSGLLDVPNHRSSHTHATPRGGGLAIVLAFMACASPALFNDNDQWAWISFFMGFACVAAVGFLDDRHPLPARVRLCVHLAASVLLVSCLSLPVPSQLEWIFWPSTIVGLLAWLVFQILVVTWLVNLTNFMDGIDGIAGVQAVGAGAGFVAIWLFNGLPVDAILPVLVFVASTLGFLVFNFPPAKIFMGDVGSGALGYAFGGFALIYAKTNFHWAIVWAILLAVFVVDATWTLIVRIARGKSPAQAHRSHGYQVAARRLKAHRPVTLMVAAILVFWLIPVAALYAQGVLPALSSLLLAYAPLMALAAYLNAGRNDD